MNDWDIVPRRSMWIEELEACLVEWEHHREAMPSQWQAVERKPIR